MVGALGLEVLEFTPGFLFACCFSSGLEDLLCLVTKCNTLKKAQIVVQPMRILLTYHLKSTVVYGQYTYPPSIYLD